MIQTKKHLINRLCFNEYWFYQSILKSDILKIAVYYNYVGKIPVLMCKHISYTLETDLSESEEEIFKSFKSNIRNEIRKTESLNFDFGINKIQTEEYIEFFNAFAKQKGLSLENKKRLSSYNKNNIIFTSAHNSSTNELLVVHVYLVDGEHARLFHSASQIHSMEDDEKRKLTGFFNKRLHWDDMKYFKSLGYLIYDWGGYSHKVDDKALMGINAFKKSFGGTEKEVVNYSSILFKMLDIIHKLRK